MLPRWRRRRPLAHRQRLPEEQAKNPRTDPGATAAATETMHHHRPENTGGRGGGDAVNIFAERGKYLQRVKKKLDRPKSDQICPPPATLLLTSAAGRSCPSTSDLACWPSRHPPESAPPLAALAPAEASADTLPSARRARARPSCGSDKGAMLPPPPGGPQQSPMASDSAPPRTKKAAAKEGLWQTGENKRKMGRGLKKSEPIG